jgi:hypothetical protein
MTYAENLARLVETHAQYFGTPNERHANPLLEALGCHTLKPGMPEWIYTPASTPPIEDDALVSETLLTLFAQLDREHSAGSHCIFSVLGALRTNDRWKQCLASEAQYRMLATALLNFSYQRAYHVTELTNALSDDVYYILASWLQPETKWKLHPTLEDVARAMFGDAWWDFSIDSSSDRPTARMQSVNDATRWISPEFLPGLVPVVKTSQAMPLPPLDVGP